MALASCLVQGIPLSECGMQRPGCHWVSPSEGTLVMFCQSRSPPMALASCLVLGIKLSVCGMQRQRSNPKSTLRSTPVYFLWIDLPPHLLESTSDHHLNSTPASRNDGWMMGADRRLLFWVPPASREQPIDSLRTLLMIPSGQNIDLSRMAHGENWSNCRDL
jgi:hypothetical protein